MLKTQGNKCSTEACCCWREHIFCTTYCKFSGIKDFFVATQTHFSQNTDEINCYMTVEDEDIKDVDQEDDEI